MEKIKNKLLKKNNFKLSLIESNYPQKLLPNEKFFTESKEQSESSNKTLNFNKTFLSFTKSKRNGDINSNSKSVKFAKTSYNNTFYPNSQNNKLYTNSNKSLSTVQKSSENLPYINQGRKSILKNKKKFLNDLTLINTVKNANTNFKTNDRIANMKTIFNKNDSLNPSNGFNKELKKIEDNKYKYSTILKNLDIWDKDHCDINKKNTTSELFKVLYNYFEKYDYHQQKRDLIYASNVMKSRQDSAYEIEEGKQNNKIFMEIMKKRKKETGTILKNTLYKTQLKFSELFDKKYTKAFDENLDIDPDTFNLLLEEEMKNLFYNQIIKDRMKYENQLHDDLLNINNIIFKRKNIKDEKTKKLKELYSEQTKLKKEFNEKYTKNRKTYWIRYEGYEQYYKALMTTGTLNFGNEQKKIGEYDDFLEKKNRISISNEPFEEKIVYRSPNPRKRRGSVVDKNVLSILKNNLKRLEDEKKFKLLHMNNEMNAKLREIQNVYEAKINKIISEEKKLENDIKILKLEINYYKKINDELVREHKIYYMNKLKKGYDCRKDGLSWVVYNLLELQVPLDYHHFPKYLTHEQIDYLKKYAKTQLKQDELKIIINVLKKKQNTQKMKDALKCMDVIDNILDLENNQKFEINEEEGLNNKDFILSKMKIDKKFFKIYQDNIDIMKNYLFKNVESYELHKVINEFKKDLYHGSNSDINKSKRDVLNVFMGDKNNKNFFNFLVDIKTNYQRLEEEKEQLFEKEKINFLNLVESNMKRRASIDNVVKNEMIKRCLFGTRLEQ